MKRIFLVTVFSGLLSVVRILSGFVVLKVVAVYTGPAGVAVLGQAQNALGVINGIVLAPAGNSVVRYTAEYVGEGFDSCTPWWRAILLWIVSLVTLVALLGSLLSTFVSEWLFGDKSYQWFILLVLAVLPLSAIGGLIPSVLNGLQNYKRFVALGSFSIIAGTAAMVTLTIVYGAHGSLLAVVISPAISGVIFFLGVTTQPWMQMRYWVGRSNPHALKGVGGYVLMAATSALTVPMSLLVVRNFLIDSVGLPATGHWQAVYKISEVYVGLVTLTLSTYYLPKLSSLVSKREIYREAHSLVKIFMPVLIAVSLLVYSFKEAIITALFSNEFLPASSLLGVQLCADMLKVFSWVYAFPMVSRGATRIFVLSEVFFSLTFVLLAFLFVDVYGVIGVPVASLLNYVGYCLFVCLLLPRLIRWG